MPDRRDRIVRQGRALVAGEIQLNVYGFAVGALGARRREWIAPEILNVLHMRWVGTQLLDDAVVVLVSIVAEIAVPSRTSIAKLSESDSLKFLPVISIACERRCILGAQRNLASFSTCSSGGTATVIRTMIANHAKMMGTANRRISRGTAWPRGSFVGAGWWLLMRP